MKKNIQSYAIIAAAKNSIQNKIFTVRPSDPLWITWYIKSQMEKETSIKEAQENKQHSLLEQIYEKKRNKVISEFRK